MAGLTAALISINENRKNFKRLAVTDALTGIYNRHGFDEQVEQYMKQNPQKHCVVAMLDIDDFKLVNDVYGHAAGDGALQKLAESMKQYFSKDVILGRNGGDEFSIFMPDCTVEEVKPFLRSLQEKPGNFIVKVKNIHLPFHWALRSILFWLMTVHSSCGVRIWHFMR